MAKFVSVAKKSLAQLVHKGESHIHSASVHFHAFTVTVIARPYPRQVAVVAVIAGLVILGSDNLNYALHSRAGNMAKVRVDSVAFVNPLAQAFDSFLLFGLLLLCHGLSASYAGLIVSV